MKKIIVYRLENAKRIGPFRGGHRMEAEYLREHHGIRQCLVDRGNMKPRSFKKLSMAGWSCAWSSEADFDKWMNNKVEYFESLGYFKVAYEISKYKLCGEQEFCTFDEELDDYIFDLIDGYQVFFNPKFAVKINNI